MKTGYWVIRTYKAGAVGEKIKYYVPGEKPTRSQRRMKTEIKKQEHNEGSQRRRVARMIRANFSERDSLVSLSYDNASLKALGEGLEEDGLYHAAHHQLRLWLRRVRRACAAAGVELRYIAVTSDLDTDTGELVRVHHHVIMNAEAAELCAAKWKKGRTHRENLKSEEEDPTRAYLAGYLLDQARRMEEDKKYIPSRNLVIPQPKDRAAAGGAELSVPRGGELLYRSAYIPGQAQYLCYVLPEAAERARAWKAAGGGRVKARYWEEDGTAAP